MHRLFRRRLILPALLVLMTAPALVEFYTDWLWFGETKHQQVFLRTMSARTMLGAAVGLFAFAALAINLRLALRNCAAGQLVFASRDGPITLSIDPRRIRRGAIVAAPVAAVALGLFASGRWLEWLQFLHRQPFGDADLVLGRDASFYVFRLPLLDTISGPLLTLVVLSGVSSVAAYALTGALDFDRDRGVRIATRAKQHLMILAAAGLLVLAFGAYLEVPRILTTPAGIIHGAATVDVAVRIPVLRALMIAALIGAALALCQIVSASWWPITLADGLYIVILAGGSAAVAVMHRFVIAPNEQARETPYIQHNIAATRKAFALDQVEERRLTGDVLLTRNDIDANAATLGNVRLWDPQPLLQTVAQIQEIRTYYDFVSVHNDRYVIDGQGSANHAVGARAELAEPAELELDQRAADVHAWLRAHARPGQPGHAGGAADDVHQGPAAAVLGGSARRRALDIFRRAGLESVPAAAVQPAVPVVQGVVER